MVGWALLTGRLAQEIGLRVSSADHPETRASAKPRIPVQGARVTVQSPVATSACRRVLHLGFEEDCIGACIANEEEKRVIDGERD